MKPDDSHIARHIAITIIAATAIMALTVISWRLFRPREPHVDVDRNIYPVRGIDLSAHNGVPDFNAIAADGIDFVYLKASEGMTFRDPAFMRNYLAARRAGLNVGAYHFFRFDCDGASQADNFLASIIGCHFQLPLVIDIEEWGNPSSYNHTAIKTNLSEMLDSVSSRRGHVMLYTNKNGVSRFLPSTNTPELWICSFTNPPIRRQWRLWQHSHCGAVKGVKGKVDLNTFNGSHHQWIEWLDSIAEKHTIK